MRTLAAPILVSFLCAVLAAGCSAGDGAASETDPGGTGAPPADSAVSPQPQATASGDAIPTAGPIDSSVSPVDQQPGAEQPATTNPAAPPADSAQPGPVQEPPDSSNPPSNPPSDPAPPSPDGPSDDPQEELPSLIGSVTFSLPSQTFENELSVELSAEAAGAEIYFTTDGSLPSTEGTLYDGSALLLTETTQLRAVAYVDGALAGLDSTAIYIRRTFDYTSDIPIMIMEGYGGGKPADKETYIDLAVMTFEPVDGVAALSDMPVLASRAGYRLRGQSSANFEKAPYRVELWDNADQDADYPLLGMPPEADWAMIGPYTDKTLIRNAFVYSLSRDMGLQTMDLRFAEVFINQDGGPLEESHYRGVYAVTQTIKNQKTRVDLKQLNPSITGEPLITGGYIFKFDQAAVDDDETVIECTGSALLSSGFGMGGPGGGFGGGGLGGGNPGGGNPGEGATDAEPEEPGTCWSDLELVDPDPVSDEQLAYIADYLQQFHDSLHEEPIGDYASLIDLRSFVDHFIINEITRDVDAYIRSHYYHKDREGPLMAGPIWDYNFSLGNFATDLEGWQWEEGRAGTNDWFRKLGPDPAFIAAVKTRWQELRQSLLSDQALSDRIDTLAAPLINAAPRDLERWPVGESGFGFGFGGGGQGMDQPADWVGQVDAMRTWTLDRIAWLDTQLL